MRRRNFLGLLGGAATWPIGAEAQRKPTMRIIGVLTGASGRASRDRIDTIVAALRDLGWKEGENVRLEIRQGREHALELVSLKPDIIVTIGGTATGQLIQTTKTVPIVFTIVPDPVGSGFIKNLSRPGGNATGFTQFEYDISGKWLQYLMQISPGVKRVGVLLDPHLPAGIHQLDVIKKQASTVKREKESLQVREIDARDVSQIKQAIADLERDGNGGLIVSSSTSALDKRELIVNLAASHKIASVYSQREYVVIGGLLSYAADFTAQFQDAARYVDRILKGQKAADLPVINPKKFLLTINMTTAKALGIDIENRFPVEKYEPIH